ncbi:MAG: helix-turn-helix transcriptional regulator [Desulfobacteraceae bacterium]|nr:helix-turn-helix transcriptional regulator [Desulfobacteraceae bacterium]MBU4035451.1 helix-turn-helix transcriptional regulator [Pseudomonadota bacterium]
MNSIPAYIKNIRSRLGLTQTEFAAMIGKRRYVISDYETGRSSPPGKVLVKIQEIEKKELNPV